MPNPSNPLTIVAVTQAKPGKAALLRAAQEQLVADTLKEEGCLGYTLYQSLNDEHTLVFVESWENERVWHAHMEGEAMQRFDATGAGEYFAGSKIHQLQKVAG